MLPTAYVGAAVATWRAMARSVGVRPPSAPADGALLRAMLDVVRRDFRADWRESCTAASRRLLMTNVDHGPSRAAYARTHTSPTGMSTARVWACRYSKKMTASPRRSF